MFWNSHNPTQRSWSTQYKPAVFYHDDEQKRLAEETRARGEARLSTKIATEILPATTFYPAEDYHHKYRLRQDTELMKAFQEIYVDDTDFVNSTLAARVNGYLDGYGTLVNVEAEVNSLELPAEKARKLIDRMKKRKTPTRSF